MATKYYGIYIFDEKDGSLVDIICQNNDNKVDLNNEYITGLYKIDEDDILVVTNKYAILVNINNGIFTKRSYEDIYHEELNYLYSDGEFAWSSNTSDFRSVNIKTEEKTSYGEDLKKFNINPGKITYILPDYEDENILWLGGSGTGLVKYHKKRGVIKQYTHDSLNRNSLISNDINCMIFDKFENLWIGTNIGLSKFNIKTNKFTSYTTAEGLTNNFINSILLDDDNNLWISTNKGLNKFDIEKENIINFTKMDGIHGYQFNINSSLKNKDGMMIFGSTNGITYFNPEDIENPIGNKNKVVFGDIFIGKNKVSYNNKELILEHYDKDLSIEYFLPIYENLNNITYEYMIEGIDSNWIYVDRKSYLNIKTLEPGKYTLKMRARDGHGNLTKETSMNIRVKSPIWKTPLAYLIYIVILLAIAFYIFNYVKILQNLVNHKTMKLNKQLEENKKLSEEIINNEKFKNNYFVNLSHELRTPLNVISSTEQLVTELNKSKDGIGKSKLNGCMQVVRRNTKRLLNLINNIIDTAKIESGSYQLNIREHDIVYIVEEATLSLKDYIERKGIELIIDPEMEEKIIKCDEHEIERCIVNLVSNAAKFTPEGGTIEVTIEDLDEKVKIIVKDTGIGIDKKYHDSIFNRFNQVIDQGTESKGGSGLGLTITKQIIDMHGGQISVESELGKGCKFIIIL